MLEGPLKSLMLNLLSSIAQFEHGLFLERQLKGILIAKAKRKYRGKQSKFGDGDVARIRDEFKIAMTHKNSRIVTEKQKEIWMNQ